MQTWILWLSVAISSNTNLDANPSSPWTLFYVRVVVAIITLVLVLVVIVIVVSFAVVLPIITAILLMYCIIHCACYTFLLTGWPGWVSHYCSSFVSWIMLF